ncbi:MAG: polysaccharide biosynthesis PFTS motif protein [bacterium]
MKNKLIIFESPTEWHKWIIHLYLFLGRKILVIEPFHAYHHEEKRKARFYPRELPDYILKLIEKGRIQLIGAKGFNPQELYPRAADKAVKTVESIFPKYREAHTKLFESTCSFLNSKKAEEIFRKELCDQLGKTYSINMMVNKLEHLFPCESIVFYCESNVPEYLYLHKLTCLSSQQIYEHRRVVFPFISYLLGVFSSIKQSFISMSRLTLQTIVSGLLSIQRQKAIKHKASYKFGFAVLGDRQLRNNNRRADFLVDGINIKAEEVVYLPLISLNAGQLSQINKLKGDVFFLPSIKRGFSHVSLWVKLLWLSILERPIRNGREIKCASIALAEYLRWGKVLRSISLKHFITNCDFGIKHIARNIALNELGIETWYFIDSMNSGNFGDENKDLGVLHPFWVYLNYNHLLSWNKSISRFYSQHHGSFDQTHEVGCLWAGQISNKHRSCDERFIISVFDTTYTRNSFTSYSEGIAFAEHFYKLAKDFPAVTILLKEKKACDPNYHAKLDPILSPVLLSLYEKMYTHERIKQYTNQTDAAKLMNMADLIVSFPYTSTTFEALSANKPAIWHDPLGKYRNTPYGKMGSVTTHSYEELKRKIIEIMNVKSGGYQNPIPKGSPLIDPFCDGKAIKRVRELLICN